MTIARGVAGLLLAAGLATGADPPVESLTVKPRKIANHEWVLPAGTPAEQVKWVIDRQKRLHEDFAKKFKALNTEAEQESFFEREFPEPTAPANLLIDVVDKHPKDPAVFDALLWVVRYAPRSRDQVDAPWFRARDILMRDFARHSRIGEFCRALAYEEHHLPSVEFVRAVYDKHPDAAARALAGLTRAHHLRRNAEFATFAQKQNGDYVEARVRAYGQEYVEFLLRIRPDELNKEAETILDRLVGDNELAKASFAREGKTHTVGESADAVLFEMRHLLPGKPVPEVEGEDIDGKRFKLSDYRGKVVLLDFWGDW